MEVQRSDRDRRRGLEHVTHEPAAVWSCKAGVNLQPFKRLDTKVVKTQTLPLGATILTKLIKSQYAHDKLTISLPDTSPT